MGSRMATRTPRGMLSGLRQHPALSYYDNRVLAWKFPAMLARVVAGNGTAATLHRTYLHHGQQGAGVCAEEIDGRQACCWGGCAPLPGNGAPFCLAEGVETSLAAAQLFRVPVWFCISTSGFQSFEPPEGVGKLFVFGDNDTNFVGQLAACSAAIRLKPRGWTVTVKTPPTPGDWLDELNDGVSPEAQGSSAVLHELSAPDRIRHDKVTA